MFYQKILLPLLLIISIHLISTPLSCSYPYYYFNYQIRRGLIVSTSIAQFEYVPLLTTVTCNNTRVIASGGTPISLKLPDIALESVVDVGPRVLDVGLRVGNFEVKSTSLRDVMVRYRSIFDSLSASTTTTNLDGSETNRGTFLGESSSGGSALVTLLNRPYNCLFGDILVPAVIILEPLVISPFTTLDSNQYRSAADTSNSLLSSSTIGIRLACISPPLPVTGTGVVGGTSVTTVQVVLGGDVVSSPVQLKVSALPDILHVEPRAIPIGQPVNFTIIFSAPVNVMEWGLTCSLGGLTGVMVQAGEQGDGVLGGGLESGGETVRASSVVYCLTQGLSSERIAENTRTGLYTTRAAPREGSAATPRGNGGSRRLREVVDVNTVVENSQSLIDVDGDIKLELYALSTSVGQYPVDIGSTVTVKRVYPQCGMANISTSVVLELVEDVGSVTSEMNCCFKDPSTG